jgi:nitrite reductase/ring-hydroxylating ferredoxin subunit
MADFVEVAKLDQLAPGQGMTVTVRGVPVALFNVDGTLYAIDDTCLHAGVSLGTGCRSAYKLSANSFFPLR